MSKKIDTTHILTAVGGVAVATAAFFLGASYGSKGKAEKETKPETSKSEETKTSDPKHPEVATTRVLAIATGGTSCRLAICERKKDPNGLVTVEVKKRETVGTTTTKTFLEDITKFISGETLDELGIASFGPISLDKSKEEYGNILATPKEGWSNFPILHQVKTLSGLKCAYMDTDVNAAAVAEFKKGNHGCKNSLVYITVGTGIGVGVVVDGKPVHGLTHPEGGHIIVRPDKEDQDFEGVCPFHKSCAEGFATNVSIAKRLGMSVHDLPTAPKDHDVWRRAAYYIAQICLNATLLISPEVIVIGGGVIKQETLLPRVREYFLELLNGYVKSSLFQTTNVDAYIKLPGLGDDVEIIGASLLSESK